MHDSALTILEHIYFAADSAEISPASQPIVDAIAATLRGNPDIRRVEVEGHADPGEERPWAVSAQRAEAVRQALVTAGVDPEVLVVRPIRGGPPPPGSAIGGPNSGSPSGARRTSRPLRGPR